MHKEIFTPAQVDLLPFINRFKRSFYLVGGTAIALQIGHRRSIDFDLFVSSDSLNLINIKKKYKEIKLPKKKIIYEAFDQFHIIVNDVKITFFAYPFPIEAAVIESFGKMPDLLTLSAMKVYALGGRAKWKDYVDLYYILKYYHALDEISKKAEQIYGDSFSTKLLLQQLSYFEDIDYSEEVEFIGEEIPKEEIKSFLINVATEKF